MRYATIAGTGSFLPNHIVRNEDFPTELQTSDEWIRTRTGIHSRHIADEGALTSDFARDAALRALSSAGMPPEALDLIIVATSTPDQVFPSTACILQAKLNNQRAAAFDVQAVCCGFIYALSIADQFIRSGQYHNVLVVGADIFSRILDWQDRSTCVLFGDGAGAVVLRSSDRPGILGTELRSDGSMRHLLETPGHMAGGGIAGGTPYLTMDGGAVFKFAVKSLADISKTLLARLQLPLGSVDWLIPHQANMRIIEATAKRLNIPMEQVIATVQAHGNTSAASVPLALDQGVRDGRIQKGQRVLLLGIGGGFVWGAAAFDF